jgi:eukaryotic-like serine/threonine-protein kinase
MGEAETSAKQQAEERIGTILREKWCLDQLLGLGGMAAVYSATHRNGKRAAIKILHPDAARIRDLKARFLREGYLANKVGHPGAVSILDDDIDPDGTVFLVMELLEGETVEQRWQREERLPWREVLLIADQILDVLMAAHAKQIVHRDLKPGNLFIHADGSIKILDFGIARLGVLHTDRDDTGPHVSLGTPGFMPPEQARGRTAEIDEQSDLWALGATMFAVLSGQHVHEAETANEQLLKAMTEPAAALVERAPEVPRAVRDIVDRALRFEKTERWASAAAMQRAIRDAYVQLQGEPIEAALRLSVPILRGSRSVRPDAPTLAADQPERLTTTRPVSDRSDTLDTGADAKRSRAPLVIGAALAALIGALLLLGQIGRAPPPSNSATPASAAVDTPPEPEPARQLTPVEAANPLAQSEPSEPLVPAHSASAAEHSRLPASKLRRGAPPVTKPKAAPAASAEPPPPAEIDIFTQRK